jgi:membrane protease YdiL (CAAX protease family)
MWQGKEASNQLFLNIKHGLSPESVAICIAQVGFNLRSLCAMFGIVIIIAVFEVGILELIETPEEKITITIATVLNMLVLAPIVEEIIFRVLLFNFLQKYFSILISAILASVFFALCHYGVLGAAVFGFYMITVFLITRNLMTLIVLHSLNNLVALIFILLPPVHEMVELCLFMVIAVALIVFGWRDLVELIKSVWYKKSMTNH